jgi:hypothetical protein
MLRIAARHGTSNQVYPALYLVLCLALPWLWGSAAAAFYARRDRRAPLTRGENPPSDYSI